MTGFGDRQRVALDVERAIRDAAREGNQLLAGSRARLDIAPGPHRDALLAALTRMGVRVRGRGSVEAAEADADGIGTGAVDDTSDLDFVFVDDVLVDGAFGDAAFADGTVMDGAGDPVVDRSADASARDAAPAAALPPVVVRVPGGAVPTRAPDARSRIEWAARGMPATAALIAELRTMLGGLEIRLGISLVLEPKTAAFVSALARSGCRVAVFSAVGETDPEVAAALAEEPGVTVFAPTSEVRGGTDAAGDIAAIDAENAAAILDWGPEYLIDDGSHLIRLAHTERTAALAALRGASEETTSGVRPLHEAHAVGALRIPVIAANDARTKSDFDNLIGTGQSCVLAIADCLDAAPGYRGLAGSRWVVVGYGPVGVGVARFAAALGARVTVVERDPVRALSALHDGYEASAAETALPGADVVVSATGIWHTLDERAFDILRPGAAVAVAGGIDDELALDALREAGWTSETVTADIAEWTPPQGRRTMRIIASGGGVNYTAGEGNPIGVMDLSFATQVAALLRLIGADAAGATLPAGVHVLERADEERVARAALAAYGGSADPSPDPGSARPGGAAQGWAVHRYRSTAPEA